MMELLRPMRVAWVERVFTVRLLRILFIHKDIKYP
ncbi:hypothetical protein MPL3365_20367 [Mesorhizobium plurifarium]|uniref:Uncharacterized protein n=1 Tax=Mesorhizobium plurifarium TaxID=69974 RepID=A0A090G2R7_MESPL|nr:hypothetical protein MPL3365_20367 [Mesorhizobium plurifarium]